MKHWHNRRARDRGFTLVELVVVMMIITVLAGALTVTVTNRVKMARRTRALQDITVLKTALDLYAADNSVPPSTQQGLDALRHKPSSPPVPQNWNGPYIDRPVALDPWGNEYVYHFPGQMNPQGYDIISYGADGRPGGNDWDEDIANYAEE